MKKTALFLTLIVVIAFVGNAFATAPGKNVEYPGGADGKVVFDGKTHADKGSKCGDCHTKIWPMKKGMKMTKADHVGGKLCGTCHDGTKAFGQEKPEDCAKCHKK